MKIENQKEEIKNLKEIIIEKDSNTKNELQIQEAKHRQENENLNKKIDFLTNKFKEYEEKIENETKNIKKQSNDNLEQLNKNINEINNNIDKYNNEFKVNVFSILYKSITTQLNLTNRGLLGELKEREKSKYDPLFIASQSTNDIYNLINPETKECFGTSNIDNFFIEFDLKEEIAINGMKIFSANNFFPKSFNIEIDNKIVKSIEEAKELNGVNKEMTINFDSIKSRKVRIIQTGSNWDSNSNYLLFKRIELLSNEEKYSNGVFSTLFYEKEHHDPHKIGVIISASYFDFNTFYLLNPARNTCTDDKKNSWFQIELTQGLAVIYGIKLKRTKISKLKKFKIICTDDIEKVKNNEWIKLFETNEQKQKQNQEFDIYEFDKPSPPTKFIRLVQTGKNWSDDFHLKLFYFDIFGTYLNNDL